MKKRIGQLIGWIVVFQLIAGIMGLITRPNIDPWYHTLNRSPLTPPDITFGIVWPLLYLILALVGWGLFNAPKSFFKWLLFGLFAVQMVLNWAWTPIFFGSHNIQFGLIVLCVLVLLNAVLVIGTWFFNRLISVALLPYLAWISFACYLNAYIAGFFH